MAIRFRCLHCRQLMSIAGRMAGRPVACPRCRQNIIVPDADEKSGAHREPAKAISKNAGTLASSPVSTRNDWNDSEDRLSLRRPQTDFEELDLTPMVDVTFLLLIFFMITASFSLQKTIEIPDPDPERQGAAHSLQSLEDLLNTSILVEIDARDRILIDDEPVADRRQLPELLRHRMRNDQRAELVIAAHGDCLHDSVVSVVDAAQEVGMQRIRLATAGEAD